MLKPIRVPGSHILGAPKDWDEAKHGHCEGLPIITAHGHFYSYWRFSWRDRLAVLFGRSLRLCVAASGHPPVALEVSHD